jgi:molybdenum cofactor cytidylyltransferase
MSPPARRVAAVVLAAGLSTRMAPKNKLLLPDATGRAMIARVVDNLLASTARPVLVVTGHAAAAVRAALAGREVVFIDAPDHALGLSASLRAGIAALPAEVAAALVCLGDMPLVGAALLDRLIAAHNPAAGRAVVVPTYRGQRGNPVLWDRAFFAALCALTGDRGARGLLAGLAGQVAEIEADDDAVLRDFDTAASLVG